MKYLLQVRKCQKYGWLLKKLYMYIRFCIYTIKIYVVLSLILDFLDWTNLTRSISVNTHVMSINHSVVFFEKTILCGVQSLQALFDCHKSLLTHFLFFFSSNYDDSLFAEIIISQAGWIIFIIWAQFVNVINTFLKWLIFCVRRQNKSNINLFVYRVYLYTLTYL
jgi:hypothetical protein